MHWQRVNSHGNPLLATPKRDQRLSSSFVKDGIGYIALSRGMYALVDLHDFEELKHHIWTANGAGELFYATRSVRKDGKRDFNIRMHNAIMQPDDGMVVDHINRNGLDNRRSNLRVCTPLQNAWNRSNGRSRKTRGFSYNQRRGRYEASIMVGGIKHRLGSFNTAAEAAAAYNRKATELCGEFAVLNPMDDGLSNHCARTLEARKAPGHPRCQKKSLRN